MTLFGSLLPFETTLMLYAANRGIKHYKINKKAKPVNVSKVKLPPNLEKEYSSIDLERFKDTILEDKIVKFCKVMNDHFPIECRNTFYKNLDTYRFYNMEIAKGSLIIDSNGTAYSRQSDNSTNTDDSALDIDKYLYHDLFSMASSSGDDEVIYSGLSQTYFSGRHNKFAYGLNKGYTELLTHRYFGDELKPKGSSYDYEMMVASKIEDIVGKEKMEEFYFTNNLKGLVDSLKHYSSEEEVMTFISRLDLINTYFSKTRVNSYEKDKIEESINMVNDFLVKSYVVKSKDLVRDGSINSRDDLIGNIVDHTECNRVFEIKSRHSLYYYTYFTDLNDVINETFSDEELKKIDSNTEKTSKGR